MADRESKYFTLSMESLRALGGWAADCAERALPVFEKHAASDPRPRAAIEGIRVFARGGKRAARLRSLAIEAHAAARGVGDPAACAAARAAGSAAASAYTHPLADVHQTKHVVGPAAYAALALELDRGGDQRIGDREIRRAIEHAPSEAREILRQMPARREGKGRLDELLYALDAEIRGRAARRRRSRSKPEIMVQDHGGSYFRPPPRPSPARGEGDYGRPSIPAPLRITENHDRGPTRGRGGTNGRMGALIARYKGRRDPRLVAVRRGGTLKDGDHRLLAVWAADCAERVLHLFE